MPRLPGAGLRTRKPHSPASEPAAAAPAAVHAAAARLPYLQQLPQPQPLLHGREVEQGLHGGLGWGVRSSWPASQRADSASGQGLLAGRQVRQTELVP